jgi:hypothetical protein
VRALTNLQSLAQFIGEPLSAFSDDLSPHQTALFSERGRKHQKHPYLPRFLEWPPKRLHQSTIKP